MQRCYLSPEAWDADMLRLDGEYSHYVRDVLRLTPGDAVEVIDGRGHAVNAVVSGLDAAGVVLEATGPKREAPAARPFITLVQAVIKGSRMDWLVEKGTELGMDALAPMLSDRCVVRLEGTRGAKRRVRWERIALGATRQCGRYRLPEVHPVMALADALTRCAGDTILVGALTPGCRPLADVLREMGAQTPERVALVIGPEGDLTDAELEQVAAAGAIAVTFGPRVLRAETAGLFGLCLLRGILSG